MLALAMLATCVDVRYVPSGAHIEPRAGETLVFTRLRFLHAGREFFPWQVDLAPQGVATDTERHVWLLRLGRRAVSAELHPDADGSLATWLAPADYALLGSARRQGTGPDAFEVLALLRVPAGVVAAYSGELVFRTETRTGIYASYGVFGTASVEVQPMAIARAVLEQRHGVLSTEPGQSPWCVTPDLPRFSDPRLFEKSKALLDGGCAAAP